MYAPPFAEMLVQFSGLRAEDSNETLSVIGWKNFPWQIQERFYRGNRVVIEGWLAINTIDRLEGFKEKRAELTANRICVAETSESFGGNPGGGDRPSARSQRPEATSEPTADREGKQNPVKAAGALETNYDDIPF